MFAKPTEDDEAHLKATDDGKSFDDYDSAEDPTKVCLNEITDDTIKVLRETNYTSDFW